MPAFRTLLDRRPTGTSCLGHCRLEFVGLDPYNGFFRLLGTNGYFRLLAFRFFDRIGSVGSQSSIESQQLLRAARAALTSCANPLLQRRQKKRVLRMRAILEAWFPPVWVLTHLVRGRRASGQSLTPIDFRTDPASHQLRVAHSGGGNHGGSRPLARLSQTVLPLPPCRRLLQEIASPLRSRCLALPVARVAFYWK